MYAATVEIQIKELAVISRLSLDIDTSLDIYIYMCVCVL